MKYRAKSEYVYMDLPVKMSTKTMADVLYAGFETAAEFTTMWNMNRGEYTRKQNTYNTAYLKVHIHPEEIETFNTLSGLTLQKPPVISGQ